MAKKSRPIFTIRIYCRSCNAFLYKYRKEGPGKLVKCFVDGIVEDHTQEPYTCPKCGKVFARPAMIDGRPANKIVQGSVFVKGSTGKK